MKKESRIFLLFILAFIGTSNVMLSQKCQTNIVRQHNIDNNPEIVNEIIKINQFTEEWIKNYPNAIGDRSIVTIPMVVHVIWRENQENISDEQIMSQMEVLNNDFRKLNDNFSTTPVAFQNVAADVEIEFCLASIDPMGNPTNGITRTHTAIDNIGNIDDPLNTGDYYRSTNGGEDAWDVSKYINIWVCDIGDEGLLGFATQPGTADPPETDGLVIGYQFFGTTGTAANSAPNHLGRTTTHEMGHYFNLEHIWGFEFGGCSEDDLVDDTPLQETSTYGCPSFPLLDTCTPTGNGVMFHNYLDYSDDECMAIFTQGQKLRMLAALNGPRVSLLSSNGCSASVNISFSFLPSFAVFPNPAEDFFVVKSDKGSLQMSLFDILGNKKLSFEVIGEKKIDVSNLPSGLYILNCINHPGSSTKLIITDP